LILLYGIASKAYSHPSIRLKKYPVGSWLIAGFFQGFISFMACVIGIGGLGFETFGLQIYYVPAALSSTLLWGSYPMTQIYQHKEDAKRGDHTLSIKLGIIGTFHFTLFFFTLSALGFFLYFMQFHSLVWAIGFLTVLVPVIVFFLWWYYRVTQSAQLANYQNTMILNWMTSSLLNGFFLALTILSW